MKEKMIANIQKELPENYELMYHIDAKNKKVGVVMNLVALAIMLAVTVAAGVSLVIRDLASDTFLSVSPQMWLIWLAAMALYIVLHELLHGIAYKLLTKEKLTFGLSWSCAFCGVPHIYVSRRVALIALATPFAVFSVVFSVLTAWLYFVHPTYYFMSALLLGYHLGGCCGDLYLMILFLFKWKDGRILMRDLGPEQFFYRPKE